jgi:protocatechuate 3,4-dioxygenase beta subunit
MKYLKYFFFAAFLLCFSQRTFSQITITAVDSGAWNDPTNWSTGTIPTLNDNVIIPVNAPSNDTITISIPANYTAQCNNLTVNGTSGTRINFRASGVLEIYGKLESDNTIPGLSLIDNTTDTDQKSKIVFKRQSSGVIIGTNWWAGLYRLRAEISVPSNVEVTSSTDVKFMRLIVTSGIYNLNGKDLRIDSNGINNTGHLYVNSGATLKGVKHLSRVSTYTQRMSSILLYGTLEIDSTIAVNTIRIRSGGNLKSNCPTTVFTAAPTFDLSAGSLMEYSRNGDQNIWPNITYSGLKISGTGTKTIGTGNSITVSDSLIYSGTSLLSTTGTLNRGTNMWLVYAGTALQNTSTELLAATPRLKISNPTSVTLDKSIILSRELWLQNGTLSTATNSVTISSGAIITRTSGKMSGTFSFPASYTLVYNNSDSILTDNELSTTSVSRLFLNSLSVVALNKNLSVAGLCSLKNGRLNPLTKSFTVENGDSLFAINGYVDGALNVNISTQGTKNFPVGTMNGYSPVTMNFTSLVGNGTISVKATAQTHPNTQFSDSVIKRYWTISKSGNISSFNANLILKYQDSDLYSGVVENSLLVGKYDAPSWTFPAAGENDDVNNLFFIDSVSSFSDFTAGKNIPAFIGYPIARINGKKFNDLDSNGIFNVGEPGLSGWTVFANGLLSSDTSTTDANGNYVLENLYAGIYTVGEIQQQNWTQTHPASGTFTLSLRMDSDTTDINFGNVHSGSISGYVWNDLNGNGIRDAGEQGIANNWKVKISGTLISGGIKNDSTLTDDNGDYVFTNLPLGNYIVSQVVQSGWKKSFPSGNGTFAVAVFSNTNATGKNFGNFELGTISGHKFEDVNGNGAKDIGEPGIFEWTINISGVSSASVLTDQNGNYTFTNLDPGVYNVAEEIQNDWTQTFPPTQKYTETIESGTHLVGRDFGNYKNGIITGMKFNDLNGNGAIDAGEPGLQNWTFYLSGTIADTTTSDALGNYTFSSLPIGVYSVQEQLQSGWKQTFPLEISYPVSILSGTIASNRNFGNFNLGSISGVVFSDIDGDGIKDVGETGLQNVEVSLNEDITIQTNANGEYAFTQLEYGVYTVSVNVGPGNIQTLPTNNLPYTITIKSGSHSVNKDFGLFKLGTISGITFNDVNGNGSKDAGENVLANWKIRLNGPQNDSVTTDANGAFSFQNLRGGNYIVSEILQNGWYQTSPAGGIFNITMTSGFNVSSLQFGNYLLGSIAGSVFNDVNSNGTKDIGEPGIANWNLRTSGFQAETTATDANGDYMFRNLRIGNYTVSQIIPNGWFQTFPANNGTYTISITAGLNSATNNFGNFQYGIIAGKVFDDINANGVKDAGEPGIANWKTKITGTKTDSTITDANGNYTYNNLILGNYQVNQVVQSGWIQSYPAANGYAIAVVSGTNASTSDFGNYRLGSVAGTKFEDVNGNGIKETGEPVLANWKIKLNGIKIDSANTDANGNYAFANLPIGQYTVSEVLQNGWVQSLPSGGTYSVSITSGLHLTGKDFGNYRVASISGKKWNDTNGDGIKGDEELLLANWKIKISGPKNDSLLTDANGNYVFQNLFVGTYIVSEQLQSGWKQTFPANAGTHSVTLASGQNTSQINFGNFKLGVVSGTAFNDLNNNGAKDANEAGLANWKIKLSGTKTDSVLSDANGNYSFSDLTVGDYSITEEMQIGWIRSSPQNGTHTLSIASGSTITGKHFGNHLLSSISGTAYDDVNGNGTKDQTETGIQGIKIYLAGPKQDSVITDANGYYIFYYVITGTYTLSEQTPSGWFVTEPEDGSTSIAINNDGTIITNVHFGNFKFGTISGNVFNDFNSNGTREQGDTLLPAWLVKISGPIADQQFTDATGKFQFNNLTVGNYTVSQVTQQGWVQSAPALPGTFAVSLTSGSVVSALEFGNFQLGKVTGYIFNDINGNHAEDFGEPKISNWKVYLQGTAKTDSVLSDSVGVFTFKNVYPGEYTLREEIKSAWEQMYPILSNYTITVMSGATVSGNNFGNFQFGKISGTKFNDVDGNGERDFEESGIPNWTIYINGTKKDSVLTDGDGNFQFTKLSQGTYTLSEKQLPGWIQSFPPETTHSVSVISGTNSVGNDFGNYQLGTITGFVYNDLNGNASKDIGEPGLTGWTLKIAGTDTATKVSDFNGSYSFSNLLLGNYTVCQVLQTSWTQTQPFNDGCYSVLINSGTIASNRNFGNFQKASISGVLFEDKNGNSIKDPGEPGDTNWIIKISGPSLNDSTFTDNNGNYSFSGLKSGTFIVSQTLQNGWYQTFPENGFHSVPVQSGSQITNRNFGNSQFGSVSGTVFNDVNGNSTHDVNENIVENWKIFLIGTLKTDTVSTNASGFYIFPNVKIGTYIVKIDKPSNMYVSLPSSSGEYNVSILSGVHHSDKNFGIYQLGVVSGFVFIDTNGDSTYDNGEPFVANRKIRLSGFVNDSTMTNVNGEYTFHSLRVGEYVVKQAVPQGSVQTLPAFAYSLSVLGGSVFEQKNFGSFVLGSVSGFVFNDENANGQFDFDELPLADWKLKISGPTTDSTFSDNAGQFVLGNLRGGNYSLVQIPQPNWKQTFPQNNHSFTVTSNLQLTGKNFGAYELGIIRGMVFDDVTADSVFNGNDTGIVNWSVVLSFGSEKETTYTSANGIYEFMRVEQGIYTVSQVTKTNWSPTYPPEGTYSVTISSGGQIEEGKNFGNFKYGKISGMKFDDKNGNGVRDSSENAIANWKIKLSGNKIDSTLTFLDGSYSFSTLVPGNYTVSEEVQSNWIQTFPPSGNYSVLLTSGMQSLGNNFGNAKLGAISGMKFYDVNGNGIKDGNEIGLSNWKIILLGSSSSETTTTNANGNYAFTTVRPGMYSVQEINKNDWVQTFPVSGFHSVFFTSGDSILGKDFGNSRNSLLSGKIFNDLNNNNLFDIGEPGIANWKVNLSGRKTDSTLTDTNGMYQFNNNPPGTYHVTEMKRNGWKQTFPPFPGTYSLSLIDGQDTANLNFGNFQYAVISGKLYNDFNGNGIINSEDTPQQGWRVHLSGAFTDSILTDSAGFYSFANLNTGTYYVREIVKPEWYKTSPLVPRYTVEITTSGMSISQRDFCNFKYAKVGGEVFADSNGNEVRDPNESGLANWKLYLAQGSQKIDSTLTNAQGIYLFNSVRAGTFVLSSETKQNYFQTYPDSPGTFIFTSTSGFTDESNVFAIQPIVGIISGEIIPKVFSLSQNYPNPFNPTTTITFTVDAEQFTSLKLYNILGDEVAVLFNEIAEPGRYYEIQFSSEKLGSGVYIYRLESGKKAAIKKLLLLK